jgi:preprotein translocase subunit YajC
MTKYTPYEVLFGRKANIPGQLQQKTAPVYNYDDIVFEVKQKLQTCHEIARENLMKSKQQRVAKQASKVNMPILNIGDKVLLRNEKAGKLDSLWEGPYLIVEIEPNGTNVIIELSKKRKVKVHVNRLKVYQSRDRTYGKLDKDKKKTNLP